MLHGAGNSLDRSKTASETSNDVLGCLSRDHVLIGATKTRSPSGSRRYRGCDERRERHEALREPSTSARPARASYLVVIAVTSSARTITSSRLPRSNRA